ncbi:hypothetical protein ACOMHN_027377 [Nucella lapillus]
MMTSFSLVLTVILLTPLPSPVTPKVNRPLTASELDDIPLLEIQDLVDILQGFTSTNHASAPDARSALPPDSLPRDLDSQQRFQPAPPSIRHSPLSSALPIVLPASNDVGEDRSLVKLIRSFAKPTMSMDGREKRGKSSLCHFLGFPMSRGCPQLRSVQTCSGSAIPIAQRKSSPSLYLFGGALGR